MRFWPRSGGATVSFHNFNLRIFNLRVSNPNKLTVDVFLTRRRISMCQGLGTKKHDEISETDRTCWTLLVQRMFSSKVVSNLANYGDPWHYRIRIQQTRPYETSIGSYYGNRCQDLSLPMPTQTRNPYPLGVAGKVIELSIGDVLH